ncbi:hypothetical protein FACS1894139_08300 [Planctomycetales bacterium]|nr:hypothetical protein FACS1894107_16610 [Planctomycetales bacterium]GHS96587.1 hypothetical protein FACS1894108_01440 [Planctomycetales bacterium]GHT05087.1 hypothetical protein FACS1894139_08300 [Planctomycetales bacterium]
MENLPTNSRRLRRRLTAAIIAATVALVGAMSCAVLYRAVKNETVTATEELRQLATSHGATLQRHFQECSDVASVLAQTMGNYRYVMSDFRRRLFDANLEAMIIARREIIDIFSVWQPRTLDDLDDQYANTADSDDSGNYISRFTRQSGDIKKRPYTNWRYALANLRETMTVGRPAPRTIAGRPTWVITLTAPIVDFQTRRVVGLVGVTFDISFMQPLIEEIKPYGTGRAILYAYDGAAIAHYDLSRIGEPPGTLAPHASAEALDEAEVLDYKGLLTATYPFRLGDSKENWTLTIAIPKETVLASATAFVYYTLVVAAVVILLFGGVIYRLVAKTFASLERAENERIAAEARGERAKNEFFTKMSHELRTPLNSILGLSELMRADELSAVYRTYLYDIRKMTGVMLVLVNDVLDFAKIETGKINIAPVNYDIHDLFAKIVAVNKPLAEQKGLAFRARRDDNLPVVLFGDELRVRQIIVNLISNAIKYTTCGAVEFILTQTVRDDDKPYLAARVIDSGRGIKDANIPRLFDAFSQFDQQRNRGVTGAGLGLSLVKKITDLMGGTIEVASEEGRGSTFTAYFPLVVGDALKIVANNVYSNLFAISNGRVRVLVVDDTLVNLTVAAGFLAEHNITADTADGGESALRKSLMKEYDLILLDHMMPGMDGCETARRWRERGERLPIIAFSANATPAARQLFVEAGMDDFIAKPLDADTLNAILTRYLPAEKLTLCETGVLPEAARAENLSLRMDLDFVAELDVEQGVFNAGGNWKKYREQLREFCHLAANVAAQLAAAGKNPADKNSARVEFAPLAAVLESVAARELAAAARELLSAAAPDAATGTPDALEKFVVELDRLRAALRDTSLFDANETDAQI